MDKTLIFGHIAFYNYYFTNKKYTMTIDNMQNVPLLLIPQNANELVLLRNYHNHLIGEVNKMEMHPSHKQDVEKVLLKVINRITNSSKLEEKPVTASAFSRMVRRIFG